MTKNDFSVCIYKLTAFVEENISTKDLDLYYDFFKNFDPVLLAQAIDEFLMQEEYLRKLPVPGRIVKYYRKILKENLLFNASILSKAIKEEGVGKIGKLKIKDNLLNDFVKSIGGISKYNTLDMNDLEDCIDNFIKKSFLKQINKPKNKELSYQVNNGNLITPSRNPNGF